ncbi:MAG TPA: DUF4190 domain-containing protein [Acidimicrobiales bacterium]
MSDTPQDPTWWQASDGKWYPPQPATPPPPPEPAPPSFAPPQQPFGGQPFPGVPGAGLPSVNGQAVASMVLGIVALVFCWCWPVGGVCAIVGLPLGLVARSRITKGEADPRSKGMATAGVILCGIAIVLVIVIAIILVSADTTSFESDFD